MIAQAPRFDDDEDNEEQQDKDGAGPAATEEAQLQAISAVQEELAALDEAQAEEVLKVLKKYSALKQPVFARRQQAIKTVPEFWFRTLLAHPFIGENVSYLDQGVLTHLRSLEVVDVEGTAQDFRVNFHFNENQYFTNTTLWKEFRFKEEEAVVLSSEVAWKDTPEAQALQSTLVMVLLAQDPTPEDVQPSFFSVFHPDDRDFALGDALKEAYANALAVYMSAEFSEDEGDEEEDEEEDGKEAGDVQ